MFKRNPVIYKQPQELFCSNFHCLNEIARLSTLSNLLTKDAWDDLSEFYCIDCIVEGNVK